MPLIPKSALPRVTDRGGVWTEHWVQGGFTRVADIRPIHSCGVVTGSPGVPPGGDPTPRRGVGGPGTHPRGTPGVPQGYP